MEKLEFIDPYCRCTKRMEEYVFLLCKIMTVHDAAEQVKLSWHTIKNIDKKYIGKVTVGLAEANPTQIGVDEVAYTKGHNYLTVVRDIDLGKVIWIGLSRNKETLDSFFKELGTIKSRAIKVAVIDMWDPYIASVQENTTADIVFDKFHIAKKVNEALDTVRKQEFAQADPEERKEMKHKRFLILARNKNVEEEKREELDTLLQQNETLSKAYLLKEQVLDIFDEVSLEIALKRLKKWMRNVAKSGITAYEKVVNTIQHYLYGILNYFKHHLTNAASEAINNKIQVLKRRAYGFRDIEYFKLKIIQLCGVTHPTNQR
jgi:transposase